MTTDAEFEKLRREFEIVLDSIKALEKKAVSRKPRPNDEEKQPPQ